MQTGNNNKAKHALSSLFKTFNQKLHKKATFYWQKRISVWHMFSFLDLQGMRFINVEVLKRTQAGKKWSWGSKHWQNMTVWWGGSERGARGEKKEKVCDFLNKFKNMGEKNKTLFSWMKPACSSVGFTGDSEKSTSETVAQS